jgi:hypothetical protein
MMAGDQDEELTGLGEEFAPTGDADTGDEDILTDDDLDEEP